MKILQFAALTLPLLAMPVPVLAQSSQTVTYQCADNASFEARYQPQSVDLVLEGSEVTLPQVRSASGARYSNGETTLFTKGNEAFLERNGTTIYESCVAQGVSSQQTNQQPAPTPARPVEPEPVRGMW
jgi:membrane-bound inhibitor of C-type lysozyme